jgi:predicted Zn-dependent protease
VSTLVSSRSAREYGLVANGAESSEGMRAPSIAPGAVDEHDVYRAIGTGLYIPNLWYLNWSDQTGGRITGMTRYACLWIEDGEPVGPIEHLRFDDSIFRMLGSSLEDLGREVHVVPDVLSYEFRSVSALSTPGLLLSSMSFTL